MGKLKNIGWTIGVVLAILSSIFIYTAVGGSSSFIGIAFLLAVIGIGALVAALWYIRFRNKTAHQTTSVTHSTTIVESLKRVFKIVTAEGQFTEIIDFTETKQKLAIFSSTKKALIIVKAKVEMGYDFSKMEWDINEADGKIRLKSVPQPYITSISPEIRYYNIDDGLFNKFTNEDFNKIQTQCIERITEVALASDLPKVAAHQAQMLISELGTMHQWQVDGVQLLN